MKATKLMLNMRIGKSPKRKILLTRMFYLCWKKKEGVGTWYRITIFLHTITFIKLKVITLK